MPELALPRDEDYTGTLTLGFHPDGELHFENGTATVEDEDVAAVLVDRYARIEYAETETDRSGDASATDAEVAEPPFDPTEYTVDEVRDALEDDDYSDAELRALLAAEEAGQGRVGVSEAINERFED